MPVTDRQVVVVTGAGSGIGLATARAFANAGYAVVVADRSEEQGTAAAAECSASGADCRFIVCDVSDEESVGRLFTKTRQFYGRLDAAFNNAGIEGLHSETDKCTVANFDKVIAVNLRGVWLCMREELRMMLPNGDGSIVNCSSVAGLVGLPGSPAYVASKHGVIGLTRTAALEYAKRGIRVNAVCPGAIQTPMLERYMGSTPGGREAMEETEPAGRIGQPEEIASAVLWLCSQGASFTTGRALAVDGGWTAG